MLMISAKMRLIFVAFFKNNYYLNLV